MHAAFRATAWRGAKIDDGCQRNVPLFGGANDGAGQRVLAGTLHTCGQANQVVFGLRGSCDAAGAIEDDHSIDLGLAFGEGAGFVDDQRIDLGESLKGFRVANEDAGVGAAADRDHDGHGRGESQRTGARNDEHGNSGDQRVREARLWPQKGPRQKGDCGGRNNGGHEVCRDSIGQALHWARGCAGLR